MSGSAIESTHFSCPDFDVWRESINVVFDVERRSQDGNAPFTASVEAFQLGDMVVTDAVLGAQRYVRPSAACGGTAWITLSSIFIGRVAGELKRQEASLKEERVRCPCSTFPVN